MLCFVQGFDGQDKDGKEKETKLRTVKNKLLRKSRFALVLMYRALENVCDYFYTGAVKI